VLAFTDATSWTPTAPGTGTLHIEIAEAAATTGSPAADAAVTTLSLQVSLSGGTAAFTAQGQPSGCVPDGATINCTFAQPAPGGTVAFDLLVDGVTTAGQTASAQILRDGATEATLPVPIALDIYVKDELTLGTSGST
jgi:hypothetical protein